MAGEIKLNQLAAGASIAALMGEAIAGTHSVINSETATHTLLAAHASKDRAVIITVYCDEVFANGTNTQTVIEVGEDGTIDKCFDHTVLVNMAAGTTRVFAFQNHATEKVIITSTAAVATGTGGVTVTAWALPTS